MGVEPEGIAVAGRILGMISTITLIISFAAGIIIGLAGALSVNQSVNFTATLRHISSRVHALLQAARRSDSLSDSDVVAEGSDLRNCWSRGQSRCALSAK